MPAAAPPQTPERSLKFPAMWPCITLSTSVSSHKLKYCPHHRFKNPDLNQWRIIGELWGHRKKRTLAHQNLSVTSGL